MKNILTSFSALVCAFAVTAPALAQDAPPPVVSEASVSLSDCRRIVKHVPSADVAYKVGVDVHGNPVVPADVEPALGGIKLPDEVVIDFGFDFAGRYGIPGTGLYTATAGILTINYDLALGALTVNGKPLDRADSRAVTKACTMMLKDAGSAAPAQ